MNPSPSRASEVVLPPWARVSAGRLRHIERVTALLDHWAAARQLSAADASAWHDAGRWHDALRDAPVEDLRAIGEPLGLPPEAWHGPAAAARLAQDGEARVDVLEAIRWHTVGHRAWSTVGRALYCADHLEPGRGDADGRRAQLAADFVDDPEAVFRAVVIARVEQARSRGLAVDERTAALAAAL
jgi:HD superfamily phosphohydrolase YqeK